MIDYNNYKSILCLNGDLPTASFFNRGLPVIAADGAANTLMKMGVTPQLVIGDLDSLEPQYASQLNLQLHYDQNLCDFQKALLYLKEKQFLPAIVLGINGGYLDHVLNNINIFLGTDCVLYAPPFCGYILRANEKKSLRLPLNTKISLMGIPSAEISTKGLKWELTDYHMSFPGYNSCFNRTIQDEIHLDVHNGVALVLIYSEITLSSLSNSRVVDGDKDVFPVI